ncbi:MerR family transcriptional regulator [Streptomyces albospinus]|uniref:MerR family transcriptional regulator n=1 Tax=Streptomyces albospinus TaxID=285515 RepID=A0ABQ2VG47_9ACTN|nr:MerR family transcriptional regulator [Streptomyces albospinus]GGU81582.1 MerR family transcriptional regulator [Streptomyces albospinus]
MFTIGDFARYGRVSARMLRHYDAIGLLRPARTDPVSGYRFYEAAQLARLNRIIALKDLGFSLQQVAAILDEQVSVPELRGMLRLRQAELAAARAAAGARLAQVEARLRTIESEGHMSADDVVLKRTETVLLAELSGIAAGYGPQDIGPVITPLYEQLCRRLEASGVTPSGPGLAYYEDAPDTPDAPDARDVPDGQRGGSGEGEARGEAIVVHAGFVIAPEALAKAAPGTVVDGTTRTPTPVPGLGFDVVMLPGLDLAATVVHRGPMSRIMPTAQNLAHWIDANGYRSAGYARELYLECPADQEKWVTEIQEPVVGDGGGHPA